MARNKRPRKAYRPRTIDPSAHLSAISGSRKLTPDEVQQGVLAVDRAYAAFASGHECAFHWRALADALNVAEALADVGICSDPESREAILAAQRALERLQRQHRAIGTWALWDDDERDLRAGLGRHKLQLTLCDYSEYRRAVTDAHRRLAGALAGNAPKDALVIVGELGSRPLEALA